MTGSVGLVTDRWGGSLVWSAGWWDGGGLIVLVSGGGIWVFSFFPFFLFLFFFTV